jgi:hypothetical protein
MASSPKSFRPLIQPAFAAIERVSCLYMDEFTGRKMQNFAAVQAAVGRLIELMPLQRRGRQIRAQRSSLRLACGTWLCVANFCPGRGHRVCNLEGHARANEDENRSLTACDFRACSAASCPVSRRNLRSPQPTRCIRQYNPAGGRAPCHPQVQSPCTSHRV